jgi:predicted RNase H-like nuclease (RuvC/YqgF family)
MRLSKAKLQEQVSLMENRDIDFEVIKHENSILKRQIKEQNQEIERMWARINELSAIVNLNVIHWGCGQNLGL